MRIQAAYFAQPESQPTDISKQRPNGWTSSSYEVAQTEAQAGFSSMSKLISKPVRYVRRTRGVACTCWVHSAIRHD